LEVNTSFRSCSAVVLDRMDGHWMDMVVEGVVGYGIG
jgi:hypothetical protein